MDQTLLLLLKYKYTILFPIAIIEGPLAALLVGFLVYLKVLEVVPAFLVMMLGDFVPDTIYYLIGHYGNKKNLADKYFSKEGKIFSHLEIIKRLWFEHTKKTMFISKLAYGLSTPLLISAGLAKVPYKKFISYSLAISAFQYGLLMCVGYYLGYSYKVAENYIKYTGIVFASLLILFIFGYFLMTKYFRKKFINIEQKEENIL